MLRDVTWDADEIERVFGAEANERLRSYLAKLSYGIVQIGHNEHSRLAMSSLKPLVFSCSPPLHRNLSSPILR